MYKKVNKRNKNNTNSICKYRKSKLSGNSVTEISLKSMRICAFIAKKTQHHAAAVVSALFIINILSLSFMCLRHFFCGDTPDFGHRGRVIIHGGIKSFDINIFNEWLKGFGLNSNS